MVNLTKADQMFGKNSEMTWQTDKACEKLGTSWVWTLSGPWSNGAEMTEKYLTMDVTGCLAFLTLRLFRAASDPIMVWTIVINFYFLYIMGWNKVLLLLLLTLLSRKNKAFLLSLTKIYPLTEILPSMHRDGIT